jgi:hypothetical protein
VSIKLRKPEQPSDVEVGGLVVTPQVWREARMQGCVGSAEHCALIGRQQAFATREASSSWLSTAPTLPEPAACASRPSSACSLRMTCRAARRASPWQRSRWFGLTSHGRGLRSPRRLAARRLCVYASTTTCHCVRLATKHREPAAGQPRWFGTVRRFPRGNSGCC